MTDSDPAGVMVRGTRDPGRVTFYGRTGEVGAMTDQERAGKIRALLEERSGYEARGMSDRAAAVSAELARLGGEAAKPADRAARRVMVAEESR